MKFTDTLKQQRQEYEDSVPTKTALSLMRDQLLDVRKDPNLERQIEAMMKMIRQFAAVAFTAGFASGAEATVKRLK